MARDTGYNRDTDAFGHRQRVAVKRLFLRAEGLVEDWSETATVRATKREQPHFGYWVVQFEDGGKLRIPEERLRAA